MERLNRKIPGIQAKVIFVDTPVIAISASQIRDKIRQNKPYRYYLHPSVFQIIKERNLYLNLGSIEK
jgi:nicotinate-nucleotide adenylyltransferase